MTEYAANDLQQDHDWLDIGYLLLFGIGFFCPRINHIGECGARHPTFTRGPMASIMPFEKPARQTA